MIPEAVATREIEEKGKNGDRELFSVRSRYILHKYGHYKNTNG
jgi:hypothetical protein